MEVYQKRSRRSFSSVEGVAYKETYANTDRYDNSKDFLKTLQPMGQISSVKDIVDAIVYLTEANQVTGEALHVDGGAHVGKW